MTQDHHSAPLPRMLRSALLRYLSLAALILPPILYLISMSLNLATQYNPNYALSLVVDSAEDNGTHHVSASPFFTCSRPPSTNLDDTTGYMWRCRRQPLIGNGAMTACYQRFKPGRDDRQICQKIVGSAALYVAAAVFAGLALFGASIVAVLRFRAAWAKEEEAPGMVYQALPSDAKGHERETSESIARSARGPIYAPYATRNIWVSVVCWFTTLLALVAFGCLLFAQILGVQSLVNEQHPTAGEDSDNGQIGRWYMGKPSLVWTTVSWLSAALGAFISVASSVGAR